MLFASTYSIVRLIVGAIELRGRSSGELQLEVLALRHEVAILRRQAKRPDRWTAMRLLSPIPPSNLHRPVCRQNGDPPPVVAHIAEMNSLVDHVPERQALFGYGGLNRVVNRARLLLEVKIRRINMDATRHEVFGRGLRMMNPDQVRQDQIARLSQAYWRAGICFHDRLWGGHRASIMPASWILGSQAEASTSKSNEPSAARR